MYIIQSVKIFLGHKHVGVIRNTILNMKNKTTDVTQWCHFTGAIFSPQIKYLRKFFLTF